MVGGGLFVCALLQEKTVTKTNELLSAMKADREALHQFPEEGWTEFQTTYYLCRRLDEFGLPYKAGAANIAPDAVCGRDEQKVAAAQKRAEANGVPASFIRELGGFTGVVVNVDTGRPGPTTACRFDIDCVCVEESASLDHVPTREGFASRNPGLMHACGHDAHMAVGLAIAQWLAENKERLCGTIRLIFQPAEEGTRGALAMTAAGVVDGVDYFIGSHVGGLSKAGDIQICTGGFLATSKIDIAFTGVPSHAGANPEKGRSALLAAAAAAMMIEGIPRHSEGVSRISIGTLHAGEGRNVTPVHARLEVETRGETAAVNEYLEENVRAMARGAAEAYRVDCQVALAGKASTAPVSPDFVKLALKVAAGIPNVGKVSEDRRPRGSEDSTIFMHRVVDRGGQAVFFGWGSKNNGHHRNDFDIEPKALLFGFEMFSRLIETLNAPRP